MVLYTPLNLYLPYINIRETVFDVDEGSLNRKCFEDSKALITNNYFSPSTQHSKDPSSSTKVPKVVLFKRSFLTFESKIKRKNISPCFILIYESYIHLSFHDFIRKRTILHKLD